MAIKSRNHSGLYKIISITLVLVMLFSAFTWLSTYEADAANDSVSDAREVDQISIVGFKQTTTGYLGGMALDNEGKVWTWGYNANGRLGIGTTGGYAGGMKRIPYFVDNNINIVQIASGYHTDYAVDDQGNVYAWGNGTYGQIGNVTTTATNNLPTKVTYFSDAGIKIKQVSVGTEIEAFVYALTEDGDVYAWGSGAYGRIPGGSTYTSTPIKLSSLDSLDIVQVELGERHAVLLTSNGKVYTIGGGAGYALGNGSTVNITVPYEVGGALSGKTVTQVSAEYYTSMALTSDGEVYQWGRIYKESSSSTRTYTSPSGLSYTYANTGTSTSVTSPEKVNYNISSASDATYNYGYDSEPKAASITAGKYSNYIIDEYGRVWCWGYNNYYGFATDGLTGSTASVGGYSKQNACVNDAILLKSMGDGDTEYAYDAALECKAPVFSGATNAATHQISMYISYGTWYADGLHPSIYNKKYCEVIEGSDASSHADDYLVDAQGRRIIYVLRRESTSPIRYSGNYYVADDSYTGAWAVNNSSTTALPAGVTEETSVPVIKESERGWIGISVDLDTFDFSENTVLSEVPYITQISTYQSATQYIDSNGNLYKSSLDGSGSIAWGWDYSPYEYGTASNNATYGLFNMYCYEIMYMRGAPRTDPLSINIDTTKSKIYKDGENTENKATTDTETATVTVTLPQGVDDSQLNIQALAQLKDLRYVFIPYDTSDSNFTTSFSNAEFEAAYASGDYDAGYVGDFDPANTYEGTLTGTTDYSFTYSVTDNGILWIYGQDVIYGTERTTTAAYTFDNFYTPVTINHQGKGDLNDDLTYPYQVYAKTDTGVTKTTVDDTNTTKYGIALDANGAVIVDPSYGYDVVEVPALSPLPTGEDGYWTLVSTSPETFTLNDLKYFNYIQVTDGDGNPLYDDNGNLVYMQTAYVHDFLYERNLANWSTITYKANLVDGTDITYDGGTAKLVVDGITSTTLTENVKNNIEITRTPSVSIDKYGIIGYKLSSDDGTADDGKIYPLTDGKFVYTPTGDVIVTFIYSPPSTLTIQKYGADDTSTGLDDAYFLIERYDGLDPITADTIWTPIKWDTVTSSWVDVTDPTYKGEATSSGGVLQYTDLIDGTYRITETQAPSSGDVKYSLLKEPIEVTLPLESALAPEAGYTGTYVKVGDTYYYYDVTYTITDAIVVNLPAAGNFGNSAYILYLTGIAVLAVSAGLFIRKIKYRYS